MERVTLWRCSRFVTKELFSILITLGTKNTMKVLKISHKILAKNINKQKNILINFFNRSSKEIIKLKKRIT